MDCFSFARLFRAAPAPAARRATPRLRPCLEALEDRLTPASTAITMPATQALTGAGPLAFGPTTNNAITLTGDTTGTPQTVFLQSNVGTLQITNPTGVTLFNNGNGLIGVTGTQAQINTALQSLTFIPPAGTTTAATDFIDALIGGTTTSAQTLVTVTPQSSTPTTGGTSVTITAPTTIPFTPGQLTTFSSANNNAITITDAAAGTTGNVTLMVQALNGSFTVPTANGTGLVSSTGNGTNFLTLTGPVSAVNTALNGLLYQTWSGKNSDFFNVMATDTFGTTGRTNTATTGTSVTGTSGGTIIANANNPSLTLTAPNGTTVVLNPNSGSTPSTSSVEDVLNQILNSGGANVTLISGGRTLTTTLR